jgi:hypothetical protein
MALGLADQRYRLRKIKILIATGSEVHLSGVWPLTICAAHFKRFTPQCAGTSAKLAIGI